MSEDLLLNYVEYVFVNELSPTTHGSAHCAPVQLAFLPVGTKSNPPKHSDRL